MDPTPDMRRDAWTRLAVCTAAAALLQLDGTLITVALPSLSNELHVGAGASAAVLSAYFCAYAVMLLPGGVLVDRFGVRRLALLGLGLFAAGAAGGAVAGSLGALIVTRLVQGAGAGLVSPAALAGAISGFPAERRGAALGIWGASAGVANLVGPLLGGVLTGAFGWRVDWWALVPLALISAWAIAARMPGPLRAQDSTERRTTRDGVVMAASFAAALTFAVMIGSFFLAEQYLQGAAGYSSLAASAVLVIIALLVAAAAPVAGRLVDTCGERLTALLGFSSAGLGLGLLGIPGMPLSSALTVVLLVPVGLGLGMLFAPTSRAALNAAPRAAHGRVSALLSLGRLLGAAIGTTLAGADISGGLTVSNVHAALLVAGVACFVLGMPAASCLGSHGRSPAAAAQHPSRVIAQ